MRITKKQFIEEMTNGKVWFAGRTHELLPEKECASAIYAQMIIEKMQPELRTYRARSTFLESNEDTRLSTVAGKGMAIEFFKRFYSDMEVLISRLYNTDNYEGARDFICYYVKKEWN